MRASAAVELTESGERDDALEALARYCTGEASVAAEGLVGPAQAEWLDRVRDDLQNYRAGHGNPPNPAFPASFDLTPPTLRFDQLAEAQGVAAARVERPEDIAPALNRALADDKPFLIDLVLGSEL